MALRSGPKMTLHGARELELALSKLTKRVGKATLERALKKIAGPIEIDAKIGASQTKEALGERGISISKKLSRRNKRGRRLGVGWVAMYIGAHSARFGLAHLVEFGTGPRQHKSGKSTGSMPARAFMRPAWDKHKGQLLKKLADELWKEINKAAKRQAKRDKKAGLK